MTAPRFGHVLTAMVTPFTVSGEVDYGAAADVARYLVEHGNDGLVVAGSTGEGSALSDEEKLALFAVVAEAVTVPVLAGSTSSDTARSVALTAQVAATGCAGILATTPAYVRPSQRGIAAHFGAVAESTELPVMLYDIPARTGRKIKPETTIEVARRYANVVALKDASGDLPAAAILKAELGPDFHLYSGDDSLLLPFLAVGATGVVSVAAHWAGDEFAALVAAAHAGDWELARALNYRLGASYAFESSETWPNPMPSKAALRHLGLNVGQCRLPLGAADAELDERAALVVGELVVARG
jgi:4-hydroxy-tetrahydrodipicolinate synthase